MCTQRTGSETPSPLHPCLFFFFILTVLLKCTIENTRWYVIHTTVFWEIYLIYLSKEVLRMMSVK